MDPRRTIGIFIDRTIGSMREIINEGESIVMTCKACQKHGVHKFVRIKPRLGEFRSIGIRVYRCDYCGAEMDVNGEVVG